MKNDLSAFKLPHVCPEPVLAKQRFSQNENWKVLLDCFLLTSSYRLHCEHPPPTDSSILTLVARTAASTTRNRSACMMER